MAFYLVDEEAWKCPKHLTKRRRSGVCPCCLKDRLSILCADCAKVRPCACSTSASSSSSSADAEAPEMIRRSRSVGIPFLRARDFVSGDRRRNQVPSDSSKTVSFWSAFKSKSRRVGEYEKENDELKAKVNQVSDCGGDSRIEDFAKMMMRSRSVSVATVLGSAGGDHLKSPEKSKGWHFPSPMKVFRQSRGSKLVNGGHLRGRC